MQQHLSSGKTPFMGIGLIFLEKMKMVQTLNKLLHNHGKTNFWFHLFLLLVVLCPELVISSCSDYGSESGPQTNNLVNYGVPIVGAGADDLNYHSGSGSRNQVRNLPGLELPDGLDDLPFYLETGYIGVGEEEEIELFYHFVRSERKPEEDPVLLWLTGGPRCSSLSPLAFQIGPVYFDRMTEYNGSLPSLVLNPNSWTKVSNIIFVDQPVDSGFSYWKSSEAAESKIIGNKESANNTYEFLRKWLIEHPEFQSNPLYIGGDSFTGFIVPIVVQYLINDVEAGKYPFLNFQGYLLGNPATDLIMEANSRIPYARGMGLISNQLFESLKENCQGKYVYVDPRNVDCLNDLQKYKSCISGLEPTNILEPSCVQYHTESKETDAEVSTVADFTSRTPPFPGCRGYGYELTEYWANDDRVQTALHIRKGTIKKWLRCRRELPYKFELESSIEYHQNISSKGYRSLIYSGDHDIWVPHISTEAWIQSLNAPIVDDWRPWFVNLQVAGYTTSYSNGMTYATIKGGGHTAQESRPEESLAMFERWTSLKPL